MHPAFLHRFFDRDQWNYELAKAAFAVQPDWVWTKLFDAMLTASVHLQTPRGSMSGFERIINGMIRLEYISVTQTAPGDGEKKTFLVATEKMPKAQLALRKAVVWSRARRAIENDRFEATERLFKDHERGAIDAGLLMRRRNKLKRDADARQQHNDRSFRMAGKGALK